MKRKIQINSSEKRLPVPSRRKYKEISNKQQPEKSLIPPPVESIPLHLQEFYSPWKGNFEWHLLQSDDDIGDYSIFLNDPVTRIRRNILEAFFAERKERNQLRKRKGLQPKKPTKGHWFYVYEVTHDEPCTICLKTGHFQGRCPYKHYVSKDAKIGPGGVLVCKCCREEGGHDGTDWIACVKDNICMICRNLGEHGTEECPKKKRKC
ncbi:hypothetical protein AQUCO_00100145v1 [Aquilegia coerulea]|uniref:Uncharacterized protein n=1 Tax=Aquilegia coerulea TaxID=218851 RepID=A0A2G5F933_AQUCA|nr:hypothetical protein AQUCO_00100145v1 [Aquilegia coerulea]